MKALGMVEVRGFLGAVSAADAALKAANVALNSEERVGGGRRTILLVGDVAAVQAAVEAAVVIAKQLNCYCTSHVIPRADKALAKLMGGKLQESAEADANSTAKKLSNDEVSAVLNKTVDANFSVKDLVSDEAVVKAETIDEIGLREELAKYKVVDLRKKAYAMNVHGMKRTAIKFANKESLIDVIIEEVKRGGIF
ncbi:BMC domain-containing protein [Veillonella intestinalis]|uniref:BMC domain-containing protein n=1 Tax=Veillonella intestinalis TaxID=2941341 RepID=UPI00203E1A66|nr:BMC domain-containing protein [Veillonella intestinalis]